MTDTRLEYLYERYRQKECSYEELEEFLTAINDQDNKLKIEGLTEKQWEESSDHVAGAAEIDWNYMFDRIVKSDTLSLTRTVPEVKLFRFWKMAAAAVIVVALGTAAWFVLRRTSDDVITAQNNQPTQNDVAPGKEGAILTLSDGRQIILDSAQNGALVIEGNTQVVKKNGRLEYSTGGSEAETVFHTMSTPRGRQYQLTLADGSKVWLNAASSITFPTAFTGSERKVEVSGEAYFEVAHNVGKPFRVVVNETEVTVLGTRFNINSYDDEPVSRITLAEGSVKVAKTTASGTDAAVTLRPGDQAEISQSSAIAVLHNVDLEYVLAWKEGLFNFEHSDFSKILREFARWYDVEVEIKGDISRTKKFFVIMSRNTSLAAVLKVLKSNGPANLSYRIEGKKLLVQSADKK